jgi:hypothetical protein
LMILDIFTVMSLYANMAPKRWQRYKI